MIRAFIEFVTSQCGWHLVRQTPNQSTSFIKIYWQLVKSTANDDDDDDARFVARHRQQHPNVADAVVTLAISKHSNIEYIRNAYQIRVNATIMCGRPLALPCECFGRNPITIKNYSYCKSNTKLSVLSKYSIRASALCPSRYSITQIERKWRQFTSKFFRRYFICFCHANEYDNLVRNGPD